MTTAEKSAFIKTLLDDGTANELTGNELTAYINVAEQLILSRAFPFARSFPAFPPRYDVLSCQLAARLIMQRGTEGETSHTENGVTRTFAGAMNEDLLRQITPAGAVL